MKTSRFRESYRSNASKLHRAVGDILKQAPFANFKIFQEYPTSRVNPACTNKRLHFDWVVLDLKLVIECHGEFHYQPVKMSGKMTDEEAQQAFKELKQRDELKYNFAVAAGFIYVVIPYTEVKIVSATYLLSRIRLLSINPAIIPVIDPKPVKATSTKYEERQAFWKELAKKRRKEAYQKSKEWARERRRLQASPSMAQDPPLEKA